MAAHPGGAPANFLAAIAKFGGRAALLGKVGTDTFGKLLTDIVMICITFLLVDAALGLLRRKVIRWEDCNNG